MYTNINEMCDMYTNINELVSRGTPIQRVGRPDSVVFGGIEAKTNIPENEICMFCKHSSATISVIQTIIKKTQQYAGYRYCEKCYDDYA